jgi:hypothetical protein
VAYRAPYLNHKNATPPTKITSQISERRKYRVGRSIGPALPSNGVRSMEHQAAFVALI